MIKEAAEHAQEDAKRKEGIEVRNHAESMIHDTEKNLDDFKAQLDSTEVEKLREKIKELREFMTAPDNEPEAIRQKAGEMQSASLKVFEQVYKQVRVHQQRRRRRRRRRRREKE